MATASTLNAFSQSPNTFKCILLRPFMTSSGTSNAFSLHLPCLLTHLKCIVQTNEMFRMQKLQPIQATSSQIKCIFCSIRLVLFETIEMHFSVIVTIFVCKMCFFKSGTVFPNAFLSNCPERLLHIERIALHPQCIFGSILCLFISR